MLEEAISVIAGVSFEGSSVREGYLFALAIIVWAGCAYTVWHYSSGGTAVRVFENGIKILSGLIIVSFAWVVLRASISGDIDWGAALWGLVPHSLPWLLQSPPRRAVDEAQPGSLSSFHDFGQVRMSLRQIPHDPPLSPSGHGHGRAPKLGYVDSSERSKSDDAFVTIIVLVLISC